MDLNGNGNGNGNGILKVVENVEESDVSFVRIIWVTHSGQYKCRVSFMFLSLHFVF